MSQPLDHFEMGRFMKQVCVHKSDALCDQEFGVGKIRIQRFILRSADDGHFSSGGGRRQRVLLMACAGSVKNSVLCGIGCLACDENQTAASKRRDDSSLLTYSPRPVNYAARTGCLTHGKYTRIHRTHGTSLCACPVCSVTPWLLCSPAPVPGLRQSRPSGPLDAPAVVWEGPA